MPPQLRTLEKIIRLNTDQHGRVDPRTLDAYADRLAAGADRAEATGDAPGADALRQLSMVHRAAAVHVRENAPKRDRRGRYGGQ